MKHLEGETVVSGYLAHIFVLSVGATLTAMVSEAEKNEVVLVRF